MGVKLDVTTLGETNFDGVSDHRADKNTDKRKENGETGLRKLHEESIINVMYL
jgi:hypothetical protein